MAVTKKIIGRLPVFCGSYYSKEGGWAKKNRVTLFGSEFESKIENNTYAPATYDEITNTVTFNTDYWDIVSNGTDAWLASDKIEALGYYVENPEWMRVLVDADDHILAGIKSDGSVEWSVGVPTPVKEYITEHLAEIMADITEDLDTKVDKEEGKSLVDSEFAGGISYIENPEFTAVYLDKDERILFGINTDGNFLFGCGVPRQVKDYIEQKIEELSLDEYESIVAFIGDYLNNTTLEELLSKKVDGEYVENPEFIEAKIDADDKILSGRKVDGTKFENNDVELNGNATVGGSLKVDGVVIKNIEDPEGRSEIITDVENKIITYRDKRGVVHENVGIKTPNIETKHIELAQEGIQDLHDDLSLVRTKKYNLPKYGTVNIKRETFYLAKTDGVSSLDDVHIEQIVEDTDANAKLRLSLCRFYKNGTSHENSNGIFCFASSDVTENNGVYTAKTKVKKLNGTCYYEITLGTRDDNNATRNTVVPGYTIEAPADSDLPEGQTKNVTIEVDQYTWEPDIRVWYVDKKPEHYCLVDMDFGYFLSGTDMPIGIKYQGSSTTANRKKNFRFTFYKNASYAKKNKIKIGEMVRLSGFNLKANWSDDTRVKEMILYAVILSIWENRPIVDRFPWDKEFGYYTGATGFIKGFPISTYINDVFYGMHTFSLKKDEKNYMLTGEDDSGIFVCGSKRDANCWKNSVASDWEDEMMDEMSQDTANSITDFLSFVNSIFIDDLDNRYNWKQITFFVDNTAYSYSNVYLNKSGKLIIYDSDTEVEITKAYVTNSLEGGVPTANSIEVSADGLNPDVIDDNMDVQGFIDYFLCMQGLLMWDSICRNMVLHTRSDKKKFYPYFYDVDLSMQASKNYNDDIFDVAYNVNSGQISYNDMSLWVNIKNMYWDEIVNRWCELRKTVLNTAYIKAVYKALADSIPDSDYSKENTRWGTSVSKNNFTTLLEKIDERLAWLDTNYFIV